MPDQNQIYATQFIPRFIPREFLISIRIDHQPKNTVIPSERSDEGPVSNAVAVAFRLGFRRHPDRGARSAPTRDLSLAFPPLTPNKKFPRLTVLEFRLHLNAPSR
jgi:hypothetical protein